MTTNDVKELPVERSDDPRRGDMAHIKHSIASLTGMLQRKSSAPCSSCRIGRGTHLIDARRSPRMVCISCAHNWKSLSQVQRMQATTDAARRG